MAEPTATGSMLDREFLNIRCRLLDLAAALDRVERADGPSDSAQRKLIGEAISLLAGGGVDRAERMQMLFSLPYDPQWRTK